MTRRSEDSLFLIMPAYNEQHLDGLKRSSVFLWYLRSSHEDTDGIEFHLSPPQLLPTLRSQ
jgi:hypothetical protein